MEKEISTKACSFDDAAPFLVKSLAGDEIPLRLECENGVSQCWRFNKGGAHMLTRAESRELTIFSKQPRIVVSLQYAFTQNDLQF